MEWNPKLVKFIVIMFVVLLEIYNVLQVIRGENIIIHIIGVVVVAGAYIVYKKYEKKKEEEDNNF